MSYGDDQCLESARRRYVGKPTCKHCGLKIVSPLNECYGVRPDRTESNPRVCCEPEATS